MRTLSWPKSANWIWRILVLGLSNTNLFSCDNMRVCVFTGPPPSPKHRRSQTVKGGETWVIALTDDVTDSIAQLQMPPWPGIRMAAAAHKHPWVCTPDHIRGGDGAQAAPLRGTQRQREGEAVRMETREGERPRDMMFASPWWVFLFFSVFSPVACQWMRYITASGVFLSVWSQLWQASLSLKSVLASGTLSVRLPACLPVCKNQHSVTVYLLQGHTLSSFRQITSCIHDFLRDNGDNDL